MKPFFESYTLLSALESGKEARTVQIDLSAAVGRVNHRGISSIAALWAFEVQRCLLTPFLYLIGLITLWCLVSAINLVSVVSGMPQGSVLCQILFLLYTSELFSFLE